MYTITGSLDGENIIQQTFREFRGYRFGELYQSEAIAQGVAERLRYEIDEEGGCFDTGIDYRVKEASPREFVTRRQCLVLVCQQCRSENIDDTRLPFLLYHDLASLTWQWLIDQDDFRHDPGCDFRLFNLPLPDDEGPIDP